MEIDYGRAVCEPNIGAREQRKRLIAGLLLSLLTLTVLMILLTHTANRWYRLTLLPFYFAVSICFFQVQEKTCIFLARRGMRKIGLRAEQVADDSQLEVLHRQMQRVQLKSLITALLFTLLTIVL